MKIRMGRQGCPRYGKAGTTPLFSQRANKILCARVLTKQLGQNDYTQYERIILSSSFFRNNFAAKFSKTVATAMQIKIGRDAYPTTKRRFLINLFIVISSLSKIDHARDLSEAGDAFTSRYCASRVPQTPAPASPASPAHRYSCSSPSAHNSLPLNSAS